MSDVSLVYVNAEDLGGYVHAEAHLREEQEGQLTVTHKFTTEIPYGNKFEQYLVMKRAIRSVMEQARFRENELKSTNIK